MSKTIFRYVLVTYATLFAGIFAAMLAIYLVVDFVDRAKIYLAGGWSWDVLVLYGYKAQLVAQQLGPAVLLLASGVAVSTLRKRGELTALSALTFGPAALYVPIGLAALVLAMGLMGFDEALVVKAGQRVDELHTERFDTWGDWRFYHLPKQWFRHGDRIFYLRSGSAGEGFEDVTILRVSARFDLLERLDAQRMTHVEGTRWHLLDLLQRRFDGQGGIEKTRSEEATLDLGVRREALQIVSGRPEQMRLPELRAQIQRRREVGLSTARFDLTLHNRFAYPLAGVPAALLAVGLALRPGRRGHLTTALVEGLGVSLCLWVLMVVARTLALNGQLAAGVAAWTPVLALSIAAAGLWLAHEGKLGWRHT